MLSESVLDELLRNTPMREYLVRAAWPDLSTESRLQIIQMVNDWPTSWVPEWLSELALSDTAPIVRYWAARLTYFKGPLSENINHPVLGPLSGRTDAQKQLYEKARADSSELVWLCADCDETLSYQTLATASQFHRLAFLRARSMPSLGEFFEWLRTAIGAGVPDRELAECAQEFVSLPAVRQDLDRNSDDFADGGEAHYAGKTIKAGWDVARIAGPALQRQLAYALPTRMGLTTLSAAELATMPAELLTALPWRTDGSEEIAALVALIREHPDRYPESAVKSVDRADNLPVPSQDERAAARVRQMRDRPRATLEAVIQLGEKVKVLGDQVQQMRQEQSTRKRGFFG